MGSGRMLGLARGVSGQKGLLDRLGRWIIAISAEVDRIELGPPDYGQAKKDPTPLVVGQGDYVILGVQGPLSGVTYDVDTGTWNLAAGKTYLLRAEIFLNTFSDGNPIDVKWVDGNGIVLTDLTMDSPAARIVEASAQGGVGVVSMIYQVPAAGGALAQARLRVTNATGTANVPSNLSTSTVLEIQE